PSVNDADMGSISPDRPVTLPEGQSQTFTATAKAGYRIDHWLVNGEVKPGSQTIEITADGNKTLEAVFVKENRNVSTTQSGSNAGTGITGTSNTPIIAIVLCLAAVAVIVAVVVVKRRKK
ncbi:MAG: hypothetical protein RSB35_07475, partial [Eubacterium sp.]